MRDLLLSNLARNQSFDKALKRGDFVDKIADEFLSAVLFERNAEKRAEAIAEMQTRIVKHFEKKVQPEARAIGIANAKAVLQATPAPAQGLNDPDYRKKILYEGDRDARARVRIVQAMVNDRANTLENRLTAFYLEPGTSPKQKLEVLKGLHEKMNEEQQAYHEKLAEHLAGNGSKPRKPNTDFMARFQDGVKTDVRVQARRAGTDAETRHFILQGHALLSWVTVNASEACPDCKRRQGITGDAAFWDKQGRPGGGATICGASCFCMLVPAKTLDENPELKQQGLETRAQPVATPAATEKALSGQRATPPKPKASAKPVKAPASRPVDVPAKRQNQLPAAFTDKRPAAPIPKKPVESAPPPARETKPAPTARRPKLNEPERNAVADYTTDRFQDINGRLRGGEPLSRDLKSIVNRVDSAIEKLPTYNEDVYRAFPVSEEQFGKFQKMYQPGQVVADKAYMSASAAERGFAGKGKNTVSMRIIDGGGADISSLSLNPGEREVIIPRGVPFEVVSSTIGETGELQVVMRRVRLAKE